MVKRDAFSLIMPETRPGFTGEKKIISPERRMTNRWIQYGISFPTFSRGLIFFPLARSTCMDVFPLNQIKGAGPFCPYGE